jgi:hypothetical protein
VTPPAEALWETTAQARGQDLRVDPCCDLLPVKWLIAHAEELVRKNSPGVFQSEVLGEGWGWRRACLGHEPAGAVEWCLPG